MLRLCLGEWGAVETGPPGEGKLARYCWSMVWVSPEPVFMLLEHNAIVNRSITVSVVQLAKGEALSGPATIDPKKDVMPSSLADQSHVELFAQSVADHIAAVRDLGNLRGTKTSQHPIFGQFDAHKWNCMFAFHLRIHLPQARFIAEKAVAR